MLILQLRNELWKLFGKKRTYIGTGMFLLAQVIFIMLLEFGNGPYRSLVSGIKGAGLSVDNYLSNLTVATITLTPTAFFLLPLYVALVGGDLVAKEAEDGTLRMILSRPVSRLRLLLLKWMAGAVFSLALVITLGLFGALFARIFFPTGGLFVFMPLEGIFGSFDGITAWERFAVVHLVMTVEACSIMSMGFMFSCFNIKPAAATILAISFFFISMMMYNMPYFRELREWFIVHHLFVWTNFFRQSIPWPEVGGSLSILAGYNLTFLIIGCAAFQTRDIKS
ncbi:MAG TPA: ABC transporter permease subunit [Verrucomicrobiae bacterium]|nr:ABC transporter permease subunit [Verrucomicrobiae bacterium]